VRERVKSIDRGRFTEREREGGIKRKAEMVVIVERERERGREGEGESERERWPNCAT
jgi:hypothetical protein